MWGNIMGDYKWEKKKIELEELAAKVKMMTDEQKLDFKISLEKRLRLLNVLFNEKNKKYEELDNIPTKRVMDANKSNICLISHLIAGIAAGIGIDVAMFGGLDINVLMWAFAGISVGFVTAVINGISYEAKPIENAFNKFRMFMLEKKIDRIEEKWQADNYLRGLIEDMEMGK